MQNLTDLGFAYIGECRAEFGRLRVDVARNGDRGPALYAFVSGDDLLYIGRTSVPLAKWLARYTEPTPTPKEVFRNRALLLSRLSVGQSVEIWALVDWEPVSHRGVDIDVPAGLEAALVRHLRPEWNAGQS